MKFALEKSLRIILLFVTLLIWQWALKQPLSDTTNFLTIVGFVLLVFPVVLIGRKVLDKRPTIRHAYWTTLFVHYALLILFGTACIRAITSHQDWIGWLLPIPVEIGKLLTIVTSSVALLAVINLALKGLGAPFAIALSEKLAVDWMYAWTRNPMVLASLAALVSAGIWFQSTLFVLWAIFLVSPALLTFVKIYEERELEIRFGAAYLQYKSRIPLLFPRKPKV